MEAFFFKWRGEQGWLLRRRIRSGRRAGSADRPFANRKTLQAFPLT